MLNQNARILIADDSKIARMGILRIFESLGYHNIVQAVDGAEAIDVHARGPLDLIVLDVVMPNLRGDEALAEIRVKDKVTPIIMLSSVSKQSEIDECRLLGITEYLLKPLSADAGRTTLSEQLERL